MALGRSGGVLRRCILGGESATGYAIYSGGCLVEWGSKKHSMVTRSSTEAEYIAMCAGAKACIGLNMIMKDLGLEVEQIHLMEDNQGSQHLTESKAVTQRSRHIYTKYHRLREKVAQHDVRVQYCPTSEMFANHFTKPLKAVKF
ncbi:hypothetical protein PI124_g18177 [Phytophthora idaei]|nr:hypothetical protein PI125_g18876 [Phytophthora idaei]KAG3137082.1 hypothetical protein PI126_g17538 [Phytophthora idaei]KAG3236818.1 hypothetical protein PI124_g18177 [Phytophthora idaei]